MNIAIYQTIILPVVLCLYETRHFTLREEHRVRVFGNRVMKNKFGTKRNEMTEGWRKFHGEDIRVLFVSPNINWVIKSRNLRCAGKWHMWGEDKCIQDFTVET
jgi:hypothetical protein